MRTIAERQLDEWVPESMPDGTKATREVRYGWPFGGRKAYEEIVEVANAWKADLVVVGAAGAGKMDRFVLGSTAERVLRSSHSPVLVVPAGTGARLKRILLPVDFSVPPEPVLEMACVLAAAFGATLCLLHAIEPLASLRALSELGLLHSDEEAAVRLQTQLETLAASCIKRRIAVRCEVRFGKPALEIVSAAAREDSDLILVPRHVRSGWKRAVLGSTAERVVRHAHRPVLVVPGPGRFTEH
jgi:nucleotide-binding universal stress UspA family protein